MGERSLHNLRNVVLFPLSIIRDGDDPYRFWTMINDFVERPKSTLLNDLLTFSVDDVLN